MRLHRHWLCADGRRFVHVASMGKGPPVIVLHGSPQSSRAVAPLMTACAESGLMAIAPDTPGNGLSTSLEMIDASIDDYADALIALLRHIGVQRAAFYGFHTGAAIAAAIAARAPQMVAAVVLDGCPIWTTAERDDLLARYLPPLIPQWDGAHLPWVWARLEEQALFFPWYETTSAGWMADGLVGSADQLNANAIDFLRAGDGYRMPYAAAFRFCAEPVLHAIAAPCWLTASATDPLCSHLDRITPAQSLFVRPCPAPSPAKHAEIAAFLARSAQASSVGAIAASSWPEGRSSNGEARGFIRLDGGDVGYRHYADDAGGVFLHDAGASAARAPIGYTALDLPGHGPAGNSWTHLPTSASAMADCLAPALAHLFDGKPAIRGEGLGARIAGALGAMAGPIDPVAAPPDFTPRWDGAHLTTLWRYLRRRAMFTAWDQPNRAHRRAGDLHLDPLQMNADAIDLLDCGPRLAQAFAMRNR